jgi:hypothetical protein
VPCYSPLKGFKSRDTGGLCFRREESDGKKMEVACGQCLGCRLDYSRMWAMRCVHESSLHEFSGGNCFITLTYRDKKPWLEDEYHVPDDWSVHKEHVQKFLKRLRKAFKQKIRYFLIGEYGSVCRHGLDISRVKCPLCNTGRPHYHAILFNCSFDDLREYQVQDGVSRYTSEKLESIWKYGNVDVAPMSFEAAAYVARYSLKKVTGPQSYEHYMAYDLDGQITFLTPEFSLMSRRPGIGKEWFDKYHTDLYPRDTVPVPGLGTIRGMPRYYDKLFEIKDPLSMEEIKEVRQAFRREHGAEYTPERLMDKYKVQKAKQELFARREL